MQSPKSSSAVSVPTERKVALQRVRERLLTMESELRSQDGLLGEATERLRTLPDVELVVDSTLLQAFDECCQSSPPVAQTMPRGVRC